MVWCPPSFFPPVMPNPPTRAFPSSSLSTLMHNTFKKYSETLDDILKQHRPQYCGIAIFFNLGAQIVLCALKIEKTFQTCFRVVSEK